MANPSRFGHCRIALLANFHTRLTVLCVELDPTRLFIVTEVDSIESAEALLTLVKSVCASKRRSMVQSSGWPVTR